MGKIQQTNSYKTVVGWYGECGNDDCQDLQLTSYASQISAVFQWDANGVLKVWKASLPVILNKAFTSLECGKLYYLYVKPGSGSFTIPNFVVSTHEAQDLGRVTASCQPTPTPLTTPTPVPCDCEPDDYITGTAGTSSSFTLSGHVLGGFAQGTKVSFKPSTFASALSAEMTLKYPNGQTAGMIVFTNAKPNNSEFIVRHGLTCYTATATDSNKIGDDTWNLTLQQSKTLSSKCGEDKPLATPTPLAPKYSLTVDKTSVNEGDSFVVTLTTQNLQSGASIPYTITGVQPEDIAQSLTGSFALSGNTDKKTFTTIADKSTEGNQTAKISLNNGQASVSVTINDTSKEETFALSANSSSVNEGQNFTVTLTTQNVADGTKVPFTITGVQSGDLSQSLSGNFTINNNTNSQTFTAIADKSTEGTETAKLSLNNGKANISVVINDTSKTEPTPTPASPTECCTANTTQYGTDGSNTPKEVTYTLQGQSKPVTILKYMMFGQGGKICVDVTGMESAQVNDSETARYFSLPEVPTTAIGSITRVYNNGKNTFYYVAPNGNCYKADYTNAGQDWQSPVVMTKSKGTSSVEPTPTPKPVPTYSLATSPSSVAEGQNFTVTLTTQHVANGTNVPFTITGIESGDLSQSLSGNFTINNNTDSKTFTAIADKQTEGNQTAKLALDNGKANVSVVIQDTSKAETFALSANPTSVSEGQNFTVTLTTQNVANGTNVPFTITGVQSGDLSQSLSGNFTVNNNTDSKTFTAVADKSTEGNETAKLALTNGKANVSVVINDTSKAPTPTPQKPSECCPSTTTQYPTDGGNSWKEVTYTLQGTSKPVTILKYMMFGDGGKLCVDVSGMESAQSNDSEGGRYFSLPENAGTAIGAVTRVYNNGKNTFYYTSKDGTCYKADYTSAGQDWQSPVVMTKTSGTASPKPTPTPKATPTPTPKKINKLEFRWASINVNGIGTRDVLQIKNILKPTNDNFSSRNVEDVWSTVYGYTGNDGSYSLSNAFWPDAAVASTYSSQHSGAITFDGLTFTLGADETDSKAGKYKQIAVALSSKVEFSHKSTESSPSYLFIYKEDNSNPNASAVGASASWPVIMKKLDPTPTPKPKTPTPKADVDCSCVPEDYFVANITSSAMVNVSGMIFAQFDKGGQVGYEKSKMQTAIASTISFKLPNGNAGGMAVLSGVKPNGAKFVYRTGDKCYSATVGSSNIVNGDYVATWATEKSLPSACADGSSFMEEINCCTDSETRIDVIRGVGEMQNGFQVTAHPDGLMDGNLCFTSTSNTYKLDNPHFISFEGLNDVNKTIKLDVSAEYEGIKFIYRLSTGECYEGYLNSSNIATFTEIQDLF